MAEETGFEIVGVVYPVPTLDTLNMDEAQVLYDYSGLGVEDFLSPPPDVTEDEKDEHQSARVKKLKNPGVLRALMHIAYQRGNKDMKAATVKSTISAQNVLEALIALAGAGEEDDAVPPVLTTELEQSSPSGSVVLSMSSGLPSANGSDQQEGIPDSIGPTRSDTSVTSGRSLSAV